MNVRRILVVLVVAILAMLTSTSASAWIAPTQRARLDPHGFDE